MKQITKDRRARSSIQVERMRRLYSQIGEPLPVDVMMDLYRHLERALSMNEKKLDPAWKKKQSKQA